jgi:hypothetical protein
VSVDFLRPKPNRVCGVRFLFDCGSFTDERLGAIRLQEAEIEVHRLVGIVRGECAPERSPTAAGLSICRQQSLCYLEEGRLVSGVT